MISKEFFGWLTIILAFVSYVPYIRDILANKTKPHIVSWLVWTALTFVIFFLQVNGGAGPGAWSTGVTGVICLGILGLAFKKSRHYTTHSDKVMLVAAVIAMGLWLVTKNGTLSAILITLVDLSGYVPTMRKSWHYPKTETLITYVLTFCKHAISLLAMQNFSLVTSLYPGYLVLANLLMIGILTGRRRVLVTKSA